MGIYGDQLTAFSEQFRTVSYYAMQTQTKGGYAERKALGKVRGVFQYVKRSDFKDENETLSDVSIPTFWTRAKLTVGNFLEIESAEDIFRIVSEQKWKHEGSFSIYILETVSGNTDKQEPIKDVDLGSNGGYW